MRPVLGRPVGDQLGRPALAMLCLAEPRRAQWENDLRLREDSSGTVHRSGWREPGAEPRRWGLGKDSPMRALQLSFGDGVPYRGPD